LPELSNLAGAAPKVASGRKDAFIPMVIIETSLRGVRLSRRYGEMESKNPSGSWIPAPEGELAM
jgi:hypothetical protein